MLLSACFRLLALLSTLTAPTGEDERTRLHVQVVNCLAVSGKVLVAVYDSEAAMRSQDPKRAIATAVVNPGQTPEAHFNLPHGNYAVTVAHDVNGNHQVDKNFLGIPTEPIGVSNGFKSRLRKPTFAECAIPLRQPSHHVRVRLVEF